MIRKSVVAKLWITIVGMVCIVLLLLSFLLQQFFDNYVYQQQAAELTRLAQTVQTLVDRNEITPGSSQSSNQLAMQFVDERILVEEPLSSSSGLGQVYQGLSQSERSAFLAGQPIVRRGGEAGSGTLSVYLRVHNPTMADIGMVQVTQQMSVLDKPLMRIRNLIVLATVLGVLLTTGLAFVISKNLSRPLIQMNQAAEAMGKGNFDKRVEVVTTDEVGRLGRTFNELANELQTTIAALSVEKEQLASILSSLVDGVLAADMTGAITLINPPALRRLSAYRAMVDDVEFSDKILPPNLMAMMRHVFDIREPLEREMTWQARDMYVTMSPLYESDGTTMRGVVFVFRDITEEKKLDRLRKDFIANVSHELRTPLSMMQGYTEALLDEFGDDPEQRHEITSIIHDETLRMKRLVNDLLNLAQLQSGQFHMSKEALDLTGVVSRIGRKFAALAADRGIVFDTDTAPVPVWVMADADRLEQVCTNLVDNALRHTRPGGRVHLSLQQRESTARLRVSDTGTGISQEDLPYIWERFYKADKARTRGVNGGTGLGLAITRHIVLEHGGDIMVESEEGKGTTFIVSLPLLTQLAE